MNIRDSEIIAQSLIEAGYRPINDIEKALLVIVNTCSVREKAAQKVFSLLGSLRSVKQANPAMKICVAGCVAQQDGQEIIERMPHVDLIIGTQHIYDLPRLLNDGRKQQIVNDLSDDYQIPRYLPHSGTAAHENHHVQPFAASPFSRFVTVMQGCNNYCTYCVVPFTRGREVSRKADDILDEVSALVQDGVSEIVLLGQNVNSYGATNPVHNGRRPYSFARLLHDVAAIDGVKRLRFTTSNPKDLSESLISCFTEIPSLCPQFHLPVQSGSDTILRHMNRKYTVAEYLSKVEMLRSARPDIALTTDIIVGFPGEQDTDFQATMEILEVVRFHGSFSFKYSDRPGTAAEKFPDKCDEETKRERLEMFQARQDEISAERNEEYVGKTLELLVENVNSKRISGRLATNHIVHLDTPLQPPQAGDFVRVVVTSAGKHSLQGRFV